MSASTSTSKYLNIAAHLPVLAQSHPDALSVVVQGKRRGNGKYAYRQLTVRDLENESNRAAVALQRAGVREGMRTVLMVRPSVEFFALTFALFKVGAVPVMVDPGMGTKNLKACLAEARPEAFVGIPKAHIARVLLGWARDTLEINVTVGRKLFWGGHRYEKLLPAEAEPVMALTQPGDIAAILFTSGSTGLPKGAVYTHATFDAQVTALREVYRIEPGERDLATFPLFALFGPALGMAAVVPDMDASRPITADPEAIRAAINDYECTNLFASPALIERIGRRGVANGYTFPSVRRVISAGAPATLESLERFKTLLAQSATVWPSYGATEALPVARIEVDELLNDTADKTRSGAGVCVGRAIGEMDVRIIKITDSPIRSWSNELEVARGTIGEICVAGPVVTESYFQRPDATTAAKIFGDGERIYHRMGDVGYLDDEDRLWFCGRKAHRVVTDKKTYFTIPCERILNAVEDVARTAIVGVSQNGSVTPVACVEPTSKHVDYESIRDHVLTLADRYPETQGIQEVLFHPSFPVDVRHNAKIFREQLAVWAAEQLR